MDMKRTKRIELTEVQAEVFDRWQDLLHEPDPSREEMRCMHLELARSMGEAPVIQIETPETLQQKLLSEITVDHLCELLGLEVDVNRQKREWAKANFRKAQEHFEKLVNLDIHNCMSEEVTSLKEFEQGFALAVRRHFLDHAGGPFILLSAFRVEGK